MRRATWLSILIVVLGLGVLTLGCGNSSDDGTGRLTLRITDAPVDDAIHVFIKFDGVEVKPEGGPAMTFDLANTQRIDLLALTNGASEFLLDGVPLPAGRYEWVRLMVNTAPDNFSGTDFSANNFCYFVDTDGTGHALTIPSGNQTGLKLNRPFLIPVGGEADFALDFDLRKSMHRANDKYILRPTIRMIDNAMAGAIRGTILNLPQDAVCANGTVYVFTGTAIVPDDIDNIPADPIASAKTFLNLSSECVYMLPFMAPGGYTLAFTWDASDDDPATDDAGVTFPVSADATVTALEVTNVPLALPLPPP